MLDLRLHPGQVPQAIPLAIERLTHQDPLERLNSAEFLTRWTGQNFWGAAAAARRQAPSVADGRRMQAQWEQWWLAARETFAPPTR